MSDNIVSQLLRVCIETADEIERLRAEVDNWVKVADDLYLLADNDGRHERLNDILNNYFIAKGFD
jgi:hypothetical protein